MTLSHAIPFYLLLVWLSLASLSLSLEKPFHFQSDDIGDAAQESDLQATILVHHITTVTVAALPVAVDHSGRKQEEARLAKTLQKNSGKWNSNHPRYRLLNALKAYLLYKPRALADIDKWRNAYKKIPKKQRAFIEANIRYSKKLNTVEHLIDTNANLTNAIVDNALDFYSISRQELDDFIKETKDRDTASDIASSKTHVQQTLKHFVRDWSAEGRHERDPTIPCILHALQEEFQSGGPTTTTTTTAPIRVLVPGAGLGRLAHDIAALSNNNNTRATFEVTTNELSAHMNIAYRHLTTLLDPSTPSPPTTFHPFIDQWSHQRTTASLVRAIAFPGTDLTTSPSPSPLLVEGDFTTAFADADADATGTYDALATLFFLDTAADALAYLRTIHALLRPGGVWVNTGPLLYGTGARLRLSLDEVVALAEGVGFEFEEKGEKADPLCGEGVGDGMGGKVRGREVPYGFDERALGWSGYVAVHWVARRKRG